MNPENMTLNGDPRLPVPRDAQNEIVGSLWKRPLQTPTVMPSNSLDWNPYFAYYTTECNMAIQYGNGQFTSVRSHRDVVTCAAKLEDHTPKTDIKTVLQSSLRQPRNPQELEAMLEGSVTLVARLISMTNIGPRAYAQDDLTSIGWNDDSTSLRELLARRFPTCAPTVSEDVVFDEEFTAHNLKRFAGLEIIWTDNLAEHLRLSSDRRRLSIFHHATFLKWQSRYASILEVISYDL